MKPDSLPATQPDILTTARLILCPPTRAADWADEYPYVTDAITGLWIGWDTPKTLAEYEAAAANALRRRAHGSYQGWSAYRDLGNDGRREFVGVVSLEWATPQMRGAWYELNFWVAEAQWGKGYAYEMARAVIDWAVRWTQLPCITMSWTHGNERSRSVIERLIPGQAPEVHPAYKNGVKLPVYHYVLDLQQARKEYFEKNRTRLARESSEAVFWPRARDIVHFVGVCGAGKTTLANRLAKRCTYFDGKALGTIDWDPHTPDHQGADQRAFSRDLDRRNNEAGGHDPAIHREIVEHSLALLDAWKRSDANVVLVDRWYESYDHLPRECWEQIEAAIKTSGFNFRRILLLVADGIQGDEEGPIRERMLHTKANRPESWWATGPASLEDWVREECAYQDDYRRICGQSRFPVLTLCTAAMAWDEYEEKIVRALLSAHLFNGLEARRSQWMQPPTSCFFNYMFVKPEKVA